MLSTQYAVCTKLNKSVRKQKCDEVGKYNGWMKAKEVCTFKIWDKKT